MGPTQSRCYAYFDVEQCASLCGLPIGHSFPCFAVISAARYAMSQVLTPLMFAAESGVERTWVVKIHRVLHEQGLKRPILTGNVSIRKCFCKENRGGIILSPISIYTGGYEGCKKPQNAIKHPIIIELIWGFCHLKPWQELFRKFHGICDKF